MIDTQEAKLEFNDAVFAPPKYVGHMLIGGKSGLRVYFRQKPNWFRRAMLRLLLDWQWVDGAP